MELQTSMALTIRGDDIAQPLDHIGNSQWVLLVVVHNQTRNDNAQHDINHTLQPCRHDHGDVVDTLDLLAADL